MRMPSTHDSMLFLTNKNHLYVIDFCCVCYAVHTDAEGNFFCDATSPVSAYAHMIYAQWDICRNSFTIGCPSNLLALSTDFQLVAKGV